MRKYSMDISFMWLVVAVIAVFLFFLFTCGTNQIVNNMTGDTAHNLESGELEVVPNSTNGYENDNNLLQDMLTSPSYYWYPANIYNGLTNGY